MSSRPSLKCMLAALALAAAGTAHAASTAWCSSTGGTPERLFAFGNTNAAPHLWMAYGGELQACAYSGVDENGYTSTITLTEATLESPLPTMAALAYYAKVPWNGTGFGNPAFLYCLQLGGTEQIGAVGSGSGWAHRKGAEVHNLCVFADQSAIDDWGLLYHSNDIIRGIDLTSVLKFANPY